MILLFLSFPLPYQHPLQEPGDSVVKSLEEQLAAAMKEIEALKISGGSSSTATPPSAAKTTSLTPNSAKTVEPPADADVES